MTLTLPTAGTNAGRTPDLRVATPTLGSDIAEFGQVMSRVGFAIEAERNDRLLQRAQIDMMDGFNRLRLDLDQIGDPEQMEATFSARAQEMRDRHLEALPQAIRQQAELRFDDLRARQAYAVGRQALDLRHSERRVMLSHARDVTLQGAHHGDADAREINFAQYAQVVQNAVALGVLNPEQGDAALRDWAVSVAQARAAALLLDAPEALLETLDGADFEVLEPTAREALRTRATAAMETRATAAATALGRDLQSATRIIRAGYAYEGLDALLANPDALAHEHGPALAAAAAFQRQEPGFAVLPPSEQAAHLRIVERRPIGAGEEHELQTRAAMRAAHDASRQAWANDPVAHAQELALIDPGPLPDPLASDPQELAAALAQRAADAAALAARGYTEEPVMFRADERDAWRAAVAPEAPPPQRARLAALVAASLPDAAPEIANQISDDPVFGFVGGLLAHGGSPRLAEEIFEGQRAIAGQHVPLPSEAARNHIWFTNFHSLFDNFAESGMRDQVMAATDALTAHRLRGDPSASENGVPQRVFVQAAHEAMGGSGQYDSRSARGGVQRVRGSLTILPEGVNGREVTAALGALAGELGQMPGQLDGLQLVPDDQADRLRAAWRHLSISGAAPQVGGELISGRTLNSVRLHALGGTAYALIYAAPDGSELVLHDEAGNPFRLDIQRLLERGQ
ncbi:MAG: hypothetical protein ACK4LQ_02080 [Pararhodobacter sp.]